MGEPSRVSKKKVVFFIFLYKQTRIPAFWPFLFKNPRNLFFAELPL